METTGFAFHKSTLRLHTTLPHLSLAPSRSSILSLESMASDPSYVWLWLSNKINYCAIGTIFKPALNCRAIKTLLTGVLRPISHPSQMWRRITTSPRPAVLPLTLG